MTIILITTEQPTIVQTMTTIGTTTVTPRGNSRSLDWRGQRGNLDKTWKGCTVTSMVRKRAASKIAKLVLGIVLFTGLFCPCGGFAISIPSPHSVESTCCDTCADEQQDMPDNSKDVPDCSCQCVCCASFLVPDKEKDSDQDAKPHFFWAVPATHRFEISIPFPERTSLLPDSLSCSICTGFLLPELGSLLI